MTDIVVTVPQPIWDDWCAEGDLPGEPWSGLYSHFGIGIVPRDVQVGDRLYVVSRGKLRGYSPIVDFEDSCGVNRAGCVVRADGAMAVTIAEGIPGFRGFRYRWWQREAEVPFPDWRTA